MRDLLHRLGERLCIAGRCMLFDPKLRVGQQFEGAYMMESAVISGYLHEVTPVR